MVFINQSVDWAATHNHLLPVDNESVYNAQRNFYVIF